MTPAYLLQLAARLGQAVALLQGSGAGPLALLGQGRGHLLALGPLLVQLLGQPPLVLLRPPRLAPLELQLHTNSKGSLASRSLSVQGSTGGFRFLQHGTVEL